MDNNLEEKPDIQENSRNPDGTFKKGFSGNPDGKPVGSLDYKTMFWKALKKLATEKDMSEEDLYMDIFQQGIVKARNGDFRFYKDANDRLFGKPTERHEITGKDGESITTINEIKWTIIKGEKQDDN